MDEKSILVNLGDERARWISEVIGNKSCNKILDLLAEENLTVSDISNKLKMPINTVDYNVKKLVKAGLVEKSSHFWSIRGKKMPTYKVSNKKIIISTKKSAGAVFAWTIGLTGLTALTIRKVFDSGKLMIGPLNTADEIMLADYAAKEAVISGAEPSLIATNVVQSGNSGIVGYLAGLGSWSWFLIGAWFAVFLFFAVTLINDKRHKL